MRRRVACAAAAPSRARPPARARARSTTRAHARRNRWPARQRFFANTASAIADERASVPFSCFARRRQARRRRYISRCQARCCSRRHRRRRLLEQRLDSATRSTTDCAAARRPRDRRLDDRAPRRALPTISGAASCARARTSLEPRDAPARRAQAHDRTSRLPQAYRNLAPSVKGAPHPATCSRAGDPRQQRSACQHRRAPPRSSVPRHRSTLRSAVRGVAAASTAALATSTSGSARARSRLDDCHRDRRSAPRRTARRPLAATASASIPRARPHRCASSSPRGADLGEHPCSRARRVSVSSATRTSPTRRHASSSAVAARRIACHDDWR